MTAKLFNGEVQRKGQNTVQVGGNEYFHDLSGHARIEKIVLPVVPETPYKRSPMKEVNHHAEYPQLSSVVMNFNQQFKTPVKGKGKA